MKNRRAYRFGLCALAAVAWMGTAQVQRALNRDRAALGLTRVEPLKNAPPVLAFTTVALGGFRGLIANVLWVRATQMQDEGHYFEMVQLADWITKLEPHFTTVWLFQSWNMVYNISVKFQDPADRWRWVLRGIELLRDEAVPLNPKDGLLYRELAWFYQHKIGYYLDDAHNYYKQQWVNEMSRVLGTSPLPDYRELLDPQTDDARARAKLLREKLKLDPARMQEVDRLYGPLDWRLPEAHAIYWALLGLEHSAGANEFQLRIVIYQCMQQSVRRGRLIPIYAEKRFEYGPNLDIIPKADGAYERMMAGQPDMEERIRVGHMNFLKDAVYLLYVHNRTSEAAAWFRKLRERYPEAAPAGQTLDEFALARLNDQLRGSSLDRVIAVIEGMISTAYYQLAIGDADHAAGLNALAQKVWTWHQQKFATQQQRMALKPMEDFRRQVLGRVLAPEGGLHPELQKQLRTALNLPAATNAPPAVKPPGAK
ncbi:MAG: hypothetical protein HY301_14555 [Verrucomicrobia bacterium]|nr:hypothetical protein [Verrucomicrobiota bacterium]